MKLLQSGKWNRMAVPKESPAYDPLLCIDSDAAATGRKGRSTSLASRRKPNCFLGVAVERATTLLERGHHSAARHRALALVLRVAHRVRHPLLHERLQHPTDFVEK